MYPGLSCLWPSVTRVALCYEHSALLLHLDISFLSSLSFWSTALLPDSMMMFHRVPLLWFVSVWLHFAPPPSSSVLLLSHYHTPLPRSQTLCLGLPFSCCITSSACPQSLPLLLLSLVFISPHASLSLSGWSSRHPPLFFLSLQTLLAPLTHEDLQTDNLIQTFGAVLLVTKSMHDLLKAACPLNWRNTSLSCIIEVCTCFWSSFTESPPSFLFRCSRIKFWSWETSCCPPLTPRQESPEESSTWGGESPPQPSPPSSSGYRVEAKLPESTEPSSDLTLGVNFQRWRRLGPAPENHL